MSTSNDSGDREEILARYAAGPAELEAAVAGLDGAGLDAALDAESWTIRQIVHHVADGDYIWKAFIQMALGNAEAEFSLLWYWEIPQTAWAGHWAYAERAIGPSLALLAANRQHTVQLVQSIPRTWERSLVIRWPDHDGERATVGQVIEMQANHAVGHAADIRRIRSAHGL